MIEWMADFMESRRLKGASEKTLEDYRVPFGLLYEFAHGRPLSLALINDWALSLMGSGKSPATVRSYLTHVQVFVRWCYHNRKIVEDFAGDIYRPKYPKKVVRIYTDAEIKQIYQCCKCESDWMEFRNKAIISLMYDSGLRRDEPCSILRENVSWEDNTIIVTGKGNKSRYVPMGKNTNWYITLYMETCPFENKYLFVNRRGEPLTSNAVKQFVSKIKAELPFEFGCHRLRHNFATNFCIDSWERTGQIDIYSLMYLLGHESIDTTERYLHYAEGIIASRIHVSHLDAIM